MKHVFPLSRPALGVCLALGLGLARGAGAEDSLRAPEISVSLRGVSEQTIEVGEPLRVAVRVGLPDDGAAALELAPAGGSWINATTVEILAARGGRVVATARPANGGGERSTRLDQEQVAGGLWWFPGDVMSSLGAGEYVVQARLVIRDGAGWKGETASVPARLQVVPASSDPERAAQRVLARIHAAILGGEPARAAGLLDGVLAGDPDNVPVLKLRAALCLRGGDPGSALVCNNRALTLAARWGGEPSGELHELARRIGEAANAGGSAPVAEAWTALPQNVFDPVRPVVGQSNGPKGEALAAPVVPPAAPATGPLPGTAARRVQSSGVSAGSPSAGVVVPATELSDAKTAAEPNAQWAASAAAGSQYGAPNYSAAKMAGAPDVPKAGDSVNAWCHHSSAKGLEWIELTYAAPRPATEVRVRQNSTPGTIVKVEALEPDGTPHLWWEGTDPYVAPATRDIAWFAVRVPPTAYPVAKVRITLNLAAISGWKEIDAVQLVGAAPP